MQLNARQLTKIGATITAQVPLPQQTTRIHNAVVKALKLGYMPTRSGEAAMVYGLLLDHLEMPGIIFSTATRRSWYRDAHIRRITPAMHEALSQWWRADRVAYRMTEDGAKQWATMMDYVKKNPRGYYSDRVIEPDWTMVKPQFYLPILSDIERTEFETVASIMRDNPEYEAKRDQALALVASGATLTVPCSS
jgi:DNA-binding PadR family transcriptional regulator